MSYACPNCGFGTLKPEKITYLRHWGDHMVTMPNFPAWRCDSCSYTRYDSAALLNVEMVFGPDLDAPIEPPYMKYRVVEGPGGRGPRRWSY
jgi:YgiT-type zinc finger domain-containing protein